MADEVGELEVELELALVVLPPAPPMPPAPVVPVVPVVPLPTLELQAAVINPMATITAAGVAQFSRVRKQAPQDGQPHSDDLMTQAHSGQTTKEEREAMKRFFIPAEPVSTVAWGETPPRPGWPARSDPG